MSNDCKITYVNNDLLILKYNNIDQKINELDHREYYLTSILDSFKKEFCFDYLCWFMINKDKINIISSYPKNWMKLYISNCYQEQDYAFKSVLNTLKPFMWTSKIGNNCFSKNHDISNLALQHGLSSGITFPLYYNKIIRSGISFSSSKSITEFKNSIYDKIDNFKLLSNIFHILLKAHYENDYLIESRNKLIRYYKKHFFY